MALVARMSGVDIVECVDGTPGSPCGDADVICDAPSIQATLAGSSDVFIMGIGVVREGDIMLPHPGPFCKCPAHAPVLTAFSSHVYANGKRIGRIGDLYTAGHVIASGAPTVEDGSPQTSG